MNEQNSEIDFEDSRVRYQNPLEESQQFENEWEGENDIGYDVYEFPSN